MHLIDAQQKQEQCLATITTLHPIVGGQWTSKFVITPFQTQKWNN